MPSKCVYQTTICRDSMYRHSLLKTARELSVDYQNLDDIIFGDDTIDVTLFAKWNEQARWSRADLAEYLQHVEHKRPKNILDTLFATQSDTQQMRSSYHKHQSCSTSDWIALGVPLFALVLVIILIVKSS